MKFKQDEPADFIRDRYDLENILEGVDLIYVYPHHQIKLNDENELEQTRSGPNWEGGVVTMATCKHYLRTYKTLKPKKVALCGVTNKLDGENYLLYLGVIEEMFDSNYDLGTYLMTHYPVAYKEKLATNNRLGDIYEPTDDILDSKYDSFNFEEPCEDHCRFAEHEKGQPKYIKDIEYETKTGQKPKTLILNPVTVHTSPELVFMKRLGRSGVVFKGEDGVREFLNSWDEGL